MGDDCFVGKEYNGKELAERIERFRDEMTKIIGEVDRMYDEYDSTALLQDRFYKIFPEFKPERGDWEGAD